jgi:hypothetical protein
MKHLLSVLFVFSCSLSGLVAQTKAVLQAANGGVTPTEVSYLDNVTSAIQTQLDSKLATTAAASTYQPLNAKITSIGDLASSAGVLINDGGGGFSYKGTQDNGQPDSDGQLVQYATGGEIYAQKMSAWLQGGSSTELRYNSLVFNNAAGTFTGSLQGPTLTGNRVWTLPDVTGTVITTGDTGTVTNAMLAGSIANSKLATDPLNASNLTSGTVPAARLGSGTANSTTYLRGDNTWQTISGSGVTSITGTANEITVTGTTTPTLSLPSALTFTGKTITGGTFSSPTLTTPALGTPSALVLTNATGSPTGISLTKAQLNTIVSDDDPAYVGTSQTYTAAQTISAAGAVSAPALRISGALYSGGTATTTQALFHIQPTGATNYPYFNTNGTAFAIILPITNTADYIVLGDANSPKFAVNKDGNFTSSGSWINSAGNVVFGAYSGGQPYITSASALVFATGGLGSGNDISLFRSAAAVLAQGSGTTAQAFRVINTYTSSTNWEAFVADWKTTANTLRIGSDVGSGGGTARDVQLVRGGTVKETIGSNTTDDAQPRKLPSYIVSGLPSASTCGAGSCAFVTDATVTTVYTTVAGGGSNKVLVISDGTNWIIH